MLDSLAEAEDKAKEAEDRLAEAEESQRRDVVASARELLETLTALEDVKRRTDALEAHANRAARRNWAARVIQKRWHNRKYQNYVRRASIGGDASTVMNKADFSARTQV